MNSTVNCGSCILFFLFPAREAELWSRHILDGLACTIIVQTHLKSFRDLLQEVLRLV